jgi:transketolase
MDDRTQLWNDLAAQIAVDSIRATTAAGSGHPTSSMSCAHLLSVLFADHLRMDQNDPRSPANDRFVLSKGHAAPALYAAFKAVGAIDDEQLLSLRRMGSPIQGHPAPVPELPWVDAATGSLGQGLAVGLGLALAIELDSSPATVWVLLGDSEMAEGSVWEAMEAVSYHDVDRLIAILDLNRLGQRGPTMHGWDGDVFVRRAQAFGWHAIQIDGHDVTSIDRAYREAAAADGPTMIVARTEKGHGATGIADADGWHGKALSAEQAEAAIGELGGIRDLRVRPEPPEAWAPLPAPEPAVRPRPAYEEAIATRKAFGETLAWLAAADHRVVTLDGEVGNSTHTEDAEKTAPERFVQLFIAEQTMIGVQTGLQALGKIAFAASFGAFLTRAADQVRMGTVSRADLRIAGSHAGVSIGEDGPSQMALEDLALFRALEGSTVLYPADGNATAALVREMADLEGISYLRTTREATPKLYDAEERFPIGGSKTLRRSPEDRVSLVGAGITVHEALAAAEVLAAEGIAARVLDCYSVKPIDDEALRRALDETGAIVVAEDHRIEGGLGEAVLSSLARTGPLAGTVTRLGVDAMPGSGSPADLRSWARIDAAAIARAARAAASA